MALLSQMNPVRPLEPCFVLILFYYVCRSFLTCLFPSSSPIKIVCASPQMCNVLHPSHPCGSEQPDSICRRVRITYEQWKIFWSFLSLVCKRKEHITISKGRVFDGINVMVRILTSCTITYTQDGQKINSPYLFFFISLFLEGLLRHWGRKQRISRSSAFSLFFLAFLPTEGLCSTELLSEKLTIFSLMGGP